MSKKKLTSKDVESEVMGMIDSRATMDDSIVLKRQRETKMSTFFKTDQMSAVAYFVSDLIAKGFNDKQILDTVNRQYNLGWDLKAVQVCKALLRKVWRAETACLMDDQIAQELAALQTQEKECWEAWEFSKKGIKHNTTRKERSIGNAPEGTYSLEEIITQDNTTAGDIKFMQHINELRKERRKLLGLYAPEKKNVSASENKGTTAIQFNIVGGDAEGNVNSALSELFNGGGLPMFGNMQQKPEEAEAQVVESNPAHDEDEEMRKQIDEFYNELVN